MFDWSNIKTLSVGERDAAIEKARRLLAVSRPEITDPHEVAYLLLLPSRSHKQEVEDLCRAISKLGPLKD